MNTYIVHILDYRGTRPDTNEPINVTIQAETVQEAVDKVREKCIIECQRIVSVYQMIECKNWK